MPADPYSILCELIISELASHGPPPNAAATTAARKTLARAVARTLATHLLNFADSLLAEEEADNRERNQTAVRLPPFLH